MPGKTTPFIVYGYYRIRRPIERTYHIDSQSKSHSITNQDDWEWVGFLASVLAKTQRRIQGEGWKCRKYSVNTLFHMYWWSKSPAIPPIGSHTRHYRGTSQTRKCSTYIAVFLLFKLRTSAYFGIRDGVIRTTVTFGLWAASNFSDFGVGASTRGSPFFHAPVHFAEIAKLRDCSHSVTFCVLSKTKDGLFFPCYWTKL